MGFKTLPSAVEPWMRGFYDQAGSYVKGTHAVLKTTVNLLYAGQTGFGSGTAPTNAPSGVSGTTQVAHQPLGAFTLPSLANGASTTVVVSNNLVRDLSHIVCYPLSDPGTGVILSFVVTARTMSPSSGAFTVTIYNNGTSSTVAHTDIGYHIFN